MPKKKNEKDPFFGLDAPLGIGIPFLIVRSVSKTIKEMRKERRK